jgi:hypothetical protein
MRKRVWDSTWDDFVDKHPEGISAPQREDAVAVDCTNVAAVTTDRVDQQQQRRVNYRKGLLGVEFRHQLGRTLEILEQRRHRLPLAPRLLRTPRYRRRL